MEWFETPATDLERASRFYEALMGVALKPLEQGAYRVAWFPRYEKAEGSTGALIKADRTPGRSGTLVYLTVPDIDAALATVERVAPAAA